jgi:Domain of unknown function (DUF1840)
MLTFRSKAGAEVLMLQAHADAVLRALARDPAPEGIFLPDQIPAALAAFEAVQRTQPPSEEAEEGQEAAPPGLAQRAWPLIDLLRRSHAAGHSVTWHSS